MTDSMDERRRALEEGYFDKKNQEALLTISSKPSLRKSPITGEPMEVVEFLGVTIDRCKTSGGVWLDGGELDQIVKRAKESRDVEGFFTKLFGGKPKK